MKAIELLQYLKDGMEMGYPSKYKINKAIKELKDIHRRGCKNCKYCKEQDDFMIFCDKKLYKNGAKMMWHSFTKDFCCNKWESK